jgi:UDP-N-acetylglucosamine transferase subunit ALG13
LVAPLDWGLGHATRCVPLVRHMLQLNWDVTLAGEGPSLLVLTQEFPELKSLPLKGYHIRYPKSGIWLIPKLLLQLPKLFRTIRLEKKWLEESMEEEKWDLVISDNRYGLSTPSTKCIFITHQLWVLSGWSKWIDRILNKSLHQYINKFQQCWIPDQEEDGGIAGKLSHPLSLDPHPSSLVPCLPAGRLVPCLLKYIGPLSRLTKQTITEGSQILILLSGPEPQRTLLEQKLLEQIKEVDAQFLFVRGLPSAKNKIANTPNVQFENHLGSEALSLAIASAKLVVCRSGYSSVMDLLKLGKKAILVPTPGQTEQLYLAKELASKNWFHIQYQESLQIKKAISDCLSETQVQPILDFDAYKQVLAELGTQ